MRRALILTVALVAGVSLWTAWADRSHREACVGAVLAYERGDYGYGKRQEREFARACKVRLGQEARP